MGLTGDIHVFLNITNEISRTSSHQNSMLPHLLCHDFPSCPELTVAPITCPNPLPDNVNLTIKYHL
jgi:hypothetical protein